MAVGLHKTCGPDFYDKCIRESYQFNKHFFRVNEPALTLCAQKPSKIPWWTPSEPEMRQMSVEFLRDLNLEKIEYKSEKSAIRCLTFVFTNDIKSPNRYTYDNEPPQ